MQDYQGNNFVVPGGQARWSVSKNLTLFPIEKHATELT